MNDLNIASSQSTPGIESDTNAGILRMHGDSYPENSFEFFDPIIQWIEDYLRLHSEALRDSALHDSLTGLDNRRSLMERLREETERAIRKGTPYGLAILDVDRFKSINDQFGHEAGDKALCAISEAIQRSLREYDVCGRWGGEEFLVLLPETSIESAMQVVERIRTGMEQVQLRFSEDDTARVTASFGLTRYRLGESFSDTINRADAGLLKAKMEGRNRVVVAG